MTSHPLRAVPALLLLALASTGCASKVVANPQPTSGDRANTAVPPPSLEPIAENVWIHKSWEHVAPWGAVLSQGLVVRSGDEVLLVDTAWTEEQTATLLTLIEASLNDAVDAVIVTHAHRDKMGGMATVNERIGRSLALPMTNADAPGRGLLPARETVGEDEAFGPLELFYPGPGHTRDNVVVYHAASKVLFGGCLIRPGDATDLGNTADADVARWAESVEAVARRFPDARVVIPSHGAAGGRELLDHTIALARAHTAR